MTSVPFKDPIILNLVCCKNSMRVDIVRGPDVTCPTCKTRYAPNGYPRVQWDAAMTRLENELVEA